MEIHASTPNRTVIPPQISPKPTVKNQWVSPLDLIPAAACYVDVQIENMADYQLAHFLNGTFFGIEYGAPFKRESVICWRYRTDGGFHVCA